MTIFIDIVKPILIAEIKRIYKKSEKKDNSWLGFLRDKELSAAKQKIARKFKEELKEKTFASDEEFQIYCEQRIKDCQLDAATRSTEKGHGEGGFGPGMIKLQLLFQKTNKFFQDNYLLNIRNDADPFHVFCYHAASYIAEKFQEDAHPSAIDKMAKNPIITSLKQLELEKKRLICLYIAKCRAELAFIENLKNNSPKTIQKEEIQKILEDSQKLNTEEGEEAQNIDPDLITKIVQQTIERLLKIDSYNKMRPSENEIEERKENIVVEAIDALIRENDQLCKKYGFKFDVPLSTTICSTVALHPKYNPSSGELKVWIYRARSVIRKEKDNERELTNSIKSLVI